MRMLLVCGLLLLSSCSWLSVEHTDGELPRVNVQTDYCDYSEVDVHTDEVMFECTIKF
jgi:hypothetical protein